MTPTIYCWHPPPLARPACWPDLRPPWERYGYLTYRVLKRLLGRPA